MLQAGEVAKMNNNWDLSYMWCQPTVKERYANRLAKSFLYYSNASRWFDCIFVVVVFADHLYVHTEYSMVEVIFREIYGGDISDRYSAQEAWWSSSTVDY